MRNYLDFEKDIKTLEEDLESSKNPFDKDGISEVNTDKIKKIEKEINEKLDSTYSNLNSWQKTMVARHEDRPRANFYINKIFSNFTLLSGDRLYGEDKSILSGFGLIDGKSVLVLGQEKGEDLNTRLERNFGMMKPEGYRKALRVMKLAEKFKLPIITLIDTPGADPGIGAEERGQGYAIANNLFEMASIKTQILSIVIGEGASGGALGIGLCDKMIMLENTWFSVISPEGCASILWKDSSKAPEAAKSLKLTPKDLMEHDICNMIVYEPSGGAHRHFDSTADILKETILSEIKELQKNLSNDFLESRVSRYDKLGVFRED